MIVPVLRTHAALLVSASRLCTWAGNYEVFLEVCPVTL